MDIRDSYTGLLGDLEHPTIETRSIGESFECVMGECVIYKLCDPSICYTPRMHCVARQNKLETPRDKDEVNKREIRECDGRAHDPDTMVVSLTRIFFIFTFFDLFFIHPGGLGIWAQ